MYTSTPPASQPLATSTPLPVALHTSANIRIERCCVVAHGKGARSDGVSGGSPHKEQAAEGKQSYTTDVSLSTLDMLLQLLCNFLQLAVKQLHENSQNNMKFDGKVVLSVLCVIYSMCSYNNKHHQGDLLKTMDHFKDNASPRCDLKHIVVYALTCL